MWFQSSVVYSCVVGLACSVLAMGCSTEKISDPQVHEASGEKGDGERVVSQETSEVKSAEVVNGKLESTQKVETERLRQYVANQKVEVIRLEAGELTDAGCAALTQAADLTQLHARFSPISDQGVAELGKLPKLRVVNLPQATFGDRAMSDFAKFPALELLRFHSANVTPIGLTAICESKSLRFLHLIEVPVDRDSLLKIGSIPTLESLYIDSTVIEDEWATALFELNPKLHVHFDQLHHDLDPAAHPHDAMERK